MSEKAKKYLAAELGLDSKGHPHAFHLEGYVAKPPYFKESDGEKKAFLGVSIGVAMPNERMMALADGTYDKNTDYGDEDGFVNLKVFGQRAESFSKECAVGLKVAVSGTFEWEPYPRKDGSDGKNLVLNVKNLVVMGSRTTDPIQNNTVTCATKVYTGEDGVNRSITYAELLTGTVISNWGLKTSPNDVDYLNLGVRVGVPVKKVADMVAGKYAADKDYGKANILSVTLFRKTAVALETILQKGAQVVLTGNVVPKEYNGEISYQMRPRVISIMKYPPKEEGTDVGAMDENGSPIEPNAGDEPDFAPMEDEDDTLPF